MTDRFTYEYLNSPTGGTGDILVVPAQVEPETYLVVPAQLEPETYLVVLAQLAKLYIIRIGTNLLRIL